ncbi:hypothetical protein M9Y10_023674 [Tritrichomonas musculus]|uniref:G domain-containing protein n=1 Tax=Tritrichomonas musculus TaxID=1915356 RepID=A0ABR2KXN0_9EUKA
MNDRLNEHTIQEVFKLVIEGEKKISEAEGKDLIIFIGPTQTGKSTTINSLLGVHLRKKKKEVEPIPPDTYIAPAGCLDEGGVSTTCYPILYTSKTTNKCFLDTQGFFDNRNNIVINMASTILLQMAINQARSVRAINLSKSEDFESGLAAFDKIGKEISHFVENENVPIFFLFNRYNVSDELQEQSFVSWPEEEKIKTIKKDLEVAFKNNVKAGEKLRQDGMNRLIQKAKSLGLISKKNSERNQVDQNDLNTIMNNQEIRDILDHNEEFQQIKQQYKYIMMLKNSFSKGYYGYIDPTSSESIERLVKDISKLPEIDPKYFIFNNDNTDRSNFDQIFLNKIIKDIEMMKQLKFSKQYTEETLTSLISTINENLQHKSEILSQIEDNFLSETMINQLMLEFDEEEIKKKKEISASIDKLKQKQNSDEQALDEFKNKGPVEVFHQHFNEKVGFFWYTSYHLRYNKNIPYIKVVEKLAKHTSRDYAIDTSSPNFEVVYTSEKKAHSILPCIPYINLISAPILCLTSHNCTGDVWIYADPSDAEPERLASLKQEIENDKQQIAELTADLVILERENKSGMKRKLENYIYFLRENLLQLENIKSCVQKTTAIFCEEVEKGSKTLSKKEEIVSHNGIIKKLYKDISQYPILNEFIDLFNSIDGENGRGNEIDLETLITNGKIIFHLNQS